MRIFNIAFLLVGLSGLPICLAQVDESRLPSFEDNSSSLWKRAQCVIPAKNTGDDDSPAILEAFRKCGKSGRIIFTNTTYHIGKVMKTIGLRDTEIQIRGTLLWSTDIDYWLNNSIPNGYQNQSSAWHLGGERLTIRGFGYGTLDGNGQAWYDFVKGQSNYPGRPHQITIIGAKDSVIEGLRFVQSQMWTMTIRDSDNVLLQDIYVNSTSSSKNPARNTDGVDGMFSNRLTFRRWHIVNGDDCISLKANSTNVLIEDSTFIKGLGFALGSIGQYNGKYERIENVTLRNTNAINTKHGAYIKTFTGDVIGYPPNGGGGGLGHIKNITITGLNYTLGRDEAFQITQCVSFQGTPGDCNTSRFNISDITLRDWYGSMNNSYNAFMRCSSAAEGCRNFHIDAETFDIKKTGDGTRADKFACRSVGLPRVGFECS
ncbi:Ff.00g064170.m01.CDS01 [Fusarium sp. VM40]|nr:Ff.00g064170.m01.CDS01 [Fusarium sp. VM40]